MQSRRVMERVLALEFVRVTEAAALAAGRLMGRGDKEAADDAAVKAMRIVFDTVQIDGTVVIGEGEMDEAPMLYTGEKLGTGHLPCVDVAVDPLEGTNVVAKGLTGGAISVLAVAEQGCLLHAPDMYMDKIAVGPKAVGRIHLDAPPAENLKAVADALGKEVQDLMVVILDRPRHHGLIQAVRQAGARIKLITDGDVSPAVAVAMDDSEVDILMGVGGAPEGVLAAAALRCIGGEMQGRLWPELDPDGQKGADYAEDVKRAQAMGIQDIHQLLTMDHLVKGEDVIFAATGITDGDLLKGVRYFGNRASTQSIVMRGLTGTRRIIEAQHRLDKKPQFLGPVS